MAYPLAIAYVSNRKNCRLQWFIDSLARQLDEPQHSDLDVQFIIVSFYNDIPVPPMPRRLSHYKFLQPKPNVWNGPHRLTKADWFAASNARNTALCVADSQWLAYVDDLSVLCPGWLSAVRRAMAAGVITFGAYKKVKNLHVEKGQIISCDEFPGGIDSRWHHGRDDAPVPCSGSWLFGCSLVAPVDALLSVNGFDENCDGLGGEDYCMGIRLQNQGFTFFYDRSMCTFESEEAHFEEPPFRKTDKGVSPADKSHSALKMAKDSNWAPNYFGEGGIRALRERVLLGQPFPIQQVPDRDWYDGQLLSEMQ